MSWSYTETDLKTTTSSGRLNVVRFLVGDTNVDDQQVQDEEISFALGQTNDDIYKASAWVARTIAAKYARYVDVELDGQVSEDYSQLRQHYSALATQLEIQSKGSGSSLYAVAGGISKTEMEINLKDKDRPRGLYIGQFDNDDGEDDLADEYY